MPDASDTQAAINNLPLSEDLLSYYRQRIAASDQEYQSTLDRLDQLKLSHEESHRLSWELHKRTQEVTELQQALSDFQAALFEERKHMLRIVAENDELKKLKDRKKIRFLLSLSGAPEEEITYFRDRLDKRLIKISRVRGPFTDLENVEDRKREEEQDLIILEDEVKGLQLMVSSLQTQLDEQRKGYDETISGLIKDRRTRIEQDHIRRDHDQQKIEELMGKIRQLRTLCRENTKELLRTKKQSHAHEQSLLEHRASLITQLTHLQHQLTQSQSTLTQSQTIIEQKVTKKQETLVHELRNRIGKLEDELRGEKERTRMIDVTSQKKIEYLKSRINQINSNYTSLKNRRDYEIQGFTTDIQSLRHQLRTLEKSLLKYTPLEDKELVLLNLARVTGERAGRIGRGLSELKRRVVETEKEVQGLVW